MRIFQSGSFEHSRVWRVSWPIAWFLVGLSVVAFLPKWVSALALNLARVEAVPIWMKTESEGIFDPNVDMRPVNTWLEIALRLDPGNQRALALEVERDLYVNGHPSQPEPPGIQVILAGLQASSIAGLSSDQQDSASKAKPMSRFAVTRYWWSLAFEQLNAAKWNESVRSYQMGFLAGTGIVPETIRHGYYMALGHQAESMGNAIGEDRARFLASEYFWLAGDVKSAVEQAENLLSSPANSAHYRSWAWYLVGVKAESAYEPGEALEAYRNAVELDGGQILASIAMKRLAEFYSRNDLLKIANDTIRRIAENIDRDGGLAINTPDGSGCWGLQLDEDLNGRSMDIPGVFVWKPAREALPAGNNWVQTGTYWIRAGDFPNLAVNPDFEWMAPPQGRDSIPGYQRNNYGPCWCGETPDPLGERTGQVAVVRIDEQDQYIMLESKSMLTVQPDEIIQVGVDGLAQGGSNAGNWAVGEFGVLWNGSAMNSTSYNIIGFIRSDLNGTGWVHREGIIKVPAGANGFQVIFWNFIPANSAKSGTIYWDNLSVVGMTSLPDATGNNWR